MNTLAESWRVIAEQASKERDPEKLLILADRLCKAFDEERAQRANLETVNWMISSSGSSACRERVGDRKTGVESCRDTAAQPQ
jgi:hypothetical protein